MEHIYYTAIYRLQGSARLVVCTQSRELERYRSPSPAARAAAQLAEAGKSLRPGQSVRLVYTLGEPGVRAWDAPGSFDRRTLDIPAYTTLLRRAADTILLACGAFEPVQGSIFQPALYNLG